MFTPPRTLMFVHTPCDCARMESSLAILSHLYQGKKKKVTRCFVWIKPFPFRSIYTSPLSFLFLMLFTLFFSFSLSVWWETTRAHPIEFSEAKSKFIPLLTHVQLQSKPFLPPPFPFMDLIGKSGSCYQPYFIFHHYPHTLQYLTIHILYRQGSPFAQLKECSLSHVHTHTLSLPHTHTLLCA